MLHRRSPLQSCYDRYHVPISVKVEKEVILLMHIILDLVMHEKVKCNSSYECAAAMNCTITPD